MNYTKIPGYLIALSASLYCMACKSPEKKEEASVFSGLVKGSWASPEENCLTGFGLCEVHFFSDEQKENMVLDSVTSKSLKPQISAMLIIHPENTKNMRIEFQETCLNWDDTFIVDTSSLAFTNVVQDFTVLPVAGTYRTNRDEGDYGSVTINIELVEN